MVTGRQHQAKEFERLLSKVPQQGLLQFFEMGPLVVIPDSEQCILGPKVSDMEREKGFER